MKQEKSKVFLELDEIATGIDTALEKLDVVSNDILENCNSLNKIEDLKLLYHMAIEPIRIKNDIINDYVNSLKDYKQQLDNIVKQELKEVK